MAADTVCFKSGSSKIIWWRLSSKIAPPAQIEGGATSSELLRRIVAEVFSDPEEARTAIMSVNGIIGSANGINLRVHQDLFTIFKQRFLNRQNLRDIVHHHLFDRFLAKKAEELRLGQ